MVKHIILWQLKEELTAEEKEHVKAEIKEGLESLQGKIPGLIDIKVNCECIILTCNIYNVNHCCPSLAFGIFGKTFFSGHKLIIDMRGG